MMPPSSAGPGTSWPTSSPHGPAADTGRPSCRGAAVAVRCGKAPGAYCIEADCSARDGVAYRGRDLTGAEYLHQPQNLHELAFALLAHPGFQKTPQRHELFRQPPAGQRRSLVERVDLLLNQGEVMQRVEHEVLALVGARMTCDHLGAA